MSGVKTVQAHCGNGQMRQDLTVVQLVTQFKTPPPMERHTMELILSVGVKDTQFQIAGSWAAIGAMARYAGRVVSFGIIRLCGSAAASGRAELVGVCTNFKSPSGRVRQYRCYSTGSWAAIGTMARNAGHVVSIGIIHL